VVLTLAAVARRPAEPAIQTLMWPLPEHLGR
jgi:hypothetical protein